MEDFLLSKWITVGKRPIFFYVERPSGDNEKGNIVSLHYIDATFGEFKNLNFIASLLTGLEMVEPTIGLTLDNKKYKTGKDIIAKLAQCAVFAKKDSNSITARRV